MSGWAGHTVTMGVATEHLAARPSQASIVLMISDGPLAWCVANYFNARFCNLAIIQEQPESKLAIVRRRARLVGWPAALGQATFGLAARLIEPFTARRRRAIVRDSGLNSIRHPSLPVHRVPSVNSEICRSLLRSLKPHVVAVYGTRMIAPQTLAALQVPFINYHAGMTPKYRGQHPAYWALVNNDKDLAGITIHLVDAGVDTGGVLYQKVVAFSPRDSILTYQWRQLAEAMPLFERAIVAAAAGKAMPHVVDLPSMKFFPPTLWNYISNGLKKGVW